MTTLAAGALVGIGLPFTLITLIRRRRRRSSATSKVKATGKGVKAAATSPKKEKATATAVQKAAGGAVKAAALVVNPTKGTGGVLGVKGAKRPKMSKKLRKQYGRQVDQDSDENAEDDDDDGMNRSDPERPNRVSEIDEEQANENRRDVKAVGGNKEGTSAGHRNRGAGVATASDLADRSRRAMCEQATGAKVVHNGADHASGRSALD